MKKVRNLIIVIATLLALLLLSACDVQSNAADVNHESETQSAGITVPSEQVDTNPGENQEATTSPTGNPDDTSDVEETVPHETSEPETNVPTETIPDAETQPAESEETKSTEPEETKPHKHDYTKKVVAPTCTSKGYTKFTCSCGKNYKEDETEKLEHVYNKKTVEATCENNGYDLYSCENCKDSYKENQKDKLGHEYETTTVVPTAKAKGYDLHKCKRCEKSYKDNYTDPVVTYTEVNETVYATQEVNIRKGPSTDYDKLGSLKKGDSIIRIGVGDNGWSKVLYNDQEAYMFSDYLSKTKPAVVDSSGYPMKYSDGTCTITIEKKWYYNAWCYVAHLQFSDYDRFGSAVAKDNRGSYETTSAAAKRLGAIFCVNGPYNWGELKDAYAVVRSGKVFLDKGIHEDLGIYNAATGKFANAGQLGLSGVLASTAVEQGLVTDTFKFWNSTLVKDGANVSNPDNDSRAQRTFIATTGKAGDIYVVVSEGRYVDGKSPGLTKYECAKVVLDLGCNYGVMLDGGGSSTMYFNGKVLNSANGNQRSVVDFVYFK